MRHHLLRLSGRLSVLAALLMLSLPGALFAQEDDFDGLDDLDIDIDLSDEDLGTDPGTEDPATDVAPAPVDEAPPPAPEALPEPSDGGLPAAVALIVPVGDTSPRTSLQFDEIAKQHFDRNPTWRVQYPELPLNNGQRPEELTRYEEGRKLLREGRGLYDSLELDSAVSILIRASTVFGESAAYLGDNRDVVLAKAYLGATYLLSGSEGLAVEAFIQGIIANESVKLSTQQFPASMVELYNKTRGQVDALPVGSFSVTSDPSNAKCFIDGKFRGITPLSVNALPAGDHYVQVERDGYLRWGKRVSHPGSEEIKVSARLRRTPRLDAFNSAVSGATGLYLDKEEQNPDSALITLGQMVKADVLVLGTATRRGDAVVIDAVMMDVSSGTRVSRKDQSFKLGDPNLGSAFDDFLASLYAPLGVAPAPPPPEPILVGSGPGTGVITGGCLTNSDCGQGEVCDSDSGRCVPEGQNIPVTQRWWFWPVTVGSALAVGGAVAAGVVLGSGEESAPKGPDTGRVEITFGGAAP